MSLDPTTARHLAEKYHTPYYLFDETIIRRQCRSLFSSIPYTNLKVRYACKALTIGTVLRIIKDEGLWIDAVSINEVDRALLAGFKAEEILYTGEGSSRLVYEQLLKKNILINCSSLDQLRLLGSLCPGSKCSIRINPGEGHGHDNKVNTGGPSSKHGIYFDQIADVKSALKKCNLKLIGIHSHIGSGTDLNHWLRINNKIFQIAQEFYDLEFMDLGGGLPVVYNQAQDPPMPLSEWGHQLAHEFSKFCELYGKKLQLQIEPGRYLVAESGFLVAEVHTIKSTPQYDFVLVNSGLNHNPRPAMYGSYHPIDFVSGDGRKLSGLHQYVIAGYLCESGDLFTIGGDGVPQPREFPELQLGDLMVMGNVGAYSHSMMSEYNSMNLPISLLRDTKSNIHVIERRGTLADLMRREVEVRTN